MMKRLYVKVRTDDALSFQIFSQEVSELAGLVKPEEHESKVAPGTTIIAPGTTVVGEVNAEGDVELSGMVKGRSCPRATF